MYLSLLCASKISSKEGVKLFFILSLKKKNLNISNYTIEFTLKNLN